MKFSLLLAVLFSAFFCLCTANDHSSRNGVMRYNRTSASSSSSPSACQYRELMTQINDRVGLLSTLDENQRSKLNALNQKLVQFESSNIARLESISVQQMDTVKRMDVMELTLKEAKESVDELKGEFDTLVRRSLALKEADDMRIFERQPRQSGNQNDMRLDTSAKLDALSILLTSTRLAVNVLENDLLGNLTRLFQVSRDIQKRINTLPSRRQLLANRHPQNSSPTFYSSSDDNLLPMSCSQVSSEENAIQRIQVNPMIEPFYVMCDQKIDGGGWTVIQNRFDGVINFNRDWLEYKAGFGNLVGEFFIGMDKLYAMTSATLHELMIVMEDFNDVKRFAKYKLFAIGNEKESYALNVLGAYEGDAGDSLTYHASHKFSTFDNDNDGWLEGNCAQAHTGAWWYNACEMANLNGQYLSGEAGKEHLFQGMYWNEFNGPTYSLKSVKMMIRPVDSSLNQRRR